MKRFLERNSDCPEIGRLNNGQTLARQSQLWTESLNFQTPTDPPPNGLGVDLKLQLNFSFLNFKKQQLTVTSLLSGLSHFNAFRFCLSCTMDGTPVDCFPALIRYNRSPWTLLDDLQSHSLSAMYHVGQCWSGMLTVPLVSHRRLTDCNRIFVQPRRFDRPAASLETDDSRRMIALLSFHSWLVSILIKILSFLSLSLSPDLKAFAQNDKV